MLFEMPSLSLARRHPYPVVSMLADNSLDIGVHVFGRARLNDGCKDQATFAHTHARAHTHTHARARAHTHECQSMQHIFTPYHPVPGWVRSAASQPSPIVLSFPCHSYSCLRIASTPVDQCNAQSGTCSCNFLNKASRRIYLSQAILQKAGLHTVAIMRFSWVCGCIFITPAS